MLNYEYDAITNTAMFSFTNTTIAIICILVICNMLQLELINNRL